MAHNEEIIEGNKLIAEFEGLEQDGNYWYRPTGNTEGLMYTHKYRRLEYHTSWDWLMPVVEKIKDTVLIERPYENLLDKLDVLNLYITAPIETVWEQCIYAIKLLNTAK